MLRKILIIIIVIVSGVNLYAGDRSLAVRYVGPSSGYLDLNLRVKVEHILSGLEMFDLIMPEHVDREFSKYSETERSSFSRQNHINSALSLNAHYLVWIKVLNSGTEAKSSCILPFLFNSSKRKFFLETEIRILDIKTNQIVAVRSFEESRSGPHGIGYLDLDKTSQPELMVPYPEQMKLYADMENRIAEEIVEEIIKVINDK